MQKRREWEWWRMEPKAGKVFVAAVLLGSAAIFVGYTRTGQTVIAFGTLVSGYFDISEQLIDVRKRLERIENAIRGTTSGGEE